MLPAASSSQAEVEVFYADLGKSHLCTLHHVTTSVHAKSIHCVYIHTQPYTRTRLHFAPCDYLCPCKIHTLCLRTYTTIHTYTHTYMFAHVFKHVHMFTHTRTHTQTHTHTRVHPCAQGHGASGVLCNCCNTVVSPSTFEAHAGHKQRRNPYDGILTQDGTSLRVLAVSGGKFVLLWTGSELCVAFSRKMVPPCVSWR